MSLVVLEGASLGFGRKTIFEGLDLRVGEHDRIGLVGPNGSGKTSLMRILSGEQSLDHGEVRRTRGISVGYLPQDIALEGGQGLMAFVLSSVPGRAGLDAEASALEDSLAQTQARFDAGETQLESELMGLAETLASVHEKLAHFDTFYSEHEAASILAGLGFKTSEHGRDLGELSGGWKMRAVLAALLFQRPDLLLLDEPTNHLDMPSVAWFSDFLQRYSQAFVLICHDREFLNEQITRVISFEPEGVRQLRGDYEHYRRQRAEEEIVLENKARNLAREREKTEQFIERFRAQANKAKAVQSRVKALEKMEQVATYEKRRVMSFSFPPCGRTGDEVVKVNGLAKAFGDNVVFDGIDLTVRRGEKIGIIGVNGAGKTTLLKMIAGELGIDAGEIRLGHKVEPGYYAQHHTEILHRESTVFDEVASRDPSAGQTRVRSLLGAFLFTGDDVEKKIGVLSGGERSRVALARILVAPGNLLLMDEPTNHLDLESSEALATSLATFDGSLIFVSHNRSFVNRLATRIWDVSSGRVETYPGTLSEYMESCRAKLAEESEAGAESKSKSKSKSKSNPQSKKAPTPKPSPSKAPDSKPRRGGVTRDKRSGAAGQVVETSESGQRGSRESERARKREDAKRRADRKKTVGPLEKKVAEIEARVAVLEAEQKKRSVALADPKVYEDAGERAKLLDEYQAAAAELDTLNDRWEVAQAELEDALASLE